MADVMHAGDARRRRSRRPTGAPETAPGPITPGENRRPGAGHRPPPRQNDSAVRLTSYATDRPGS